MNGTYKRSRSNRPLALSVLGGIGLAALAVPAIAASNPGQGVSVTVNPTTGYAVINSSTVGTPRGTTVGPSGGVPSVNVRPPGVGGGLSQTLPAGIEITGVRENAQTLRGPLGANINAGLGALRNGAVRCVTSFRCTTALGLGSIGLQALLDNMNWSLGEDGRIESDGIGRLDDYGEELPGCDNPGASTYRMQMVTHTVNEYTPGARYMGAAGGASWYCPVFNPDNRQQSLCDGNVTIRVCYYEPEGNPGAYMDYTAPSVQDITNAFNNYQPDPSDWNWLTGGLDFTRPDVTIDITDVPVLDGSNEPNFIEWSDGTSKGTFNTYTPTVTNNGSHKPEISVEDKQTETNFDNQGNPTGSSTSTTVTPPSTSTGGGGAPAAEVPTDCDFMPTVCRFIDWFTEPDPSPDPDQEIRDLVQVYEDGGRSVDLGPSMGTCPAPRVIALSFVPAVEVSFQPFCDLAAAVRFWLLAIAYFGAAYLTVRSI